MASVEGKGEQNGPIQVQKGEEHDHGEVSAMAAQDYPIPSPRSVASATRDGDGDGAGILEDRGDGVTKAKGKRRRSRRKAQPQQQQTLPKAGTSDDTAMDGQQDLEPLAEQDFRAAVARLGIAIREASTHIDITKIIDGLPEPTDIDAIQLCMKALVDEFFKGG